MNDLAIFLGRFHPLLVHFPIALLALSAALHALAFVTRGSRPPASPPPYLQAAGLLLWLGALGAVASAIAGLLLATSGHYSGDTFTRHQWLGLILAGLSLMTALIWTVGDRGARWPALQTGLVVTCGLLLVPVGHLGANLTHGEDHLAEYAPAFLRGIVGGGRTETPPVRSPETTTVHADLIAPTLQTHCVSCHGPAKVEGGLRLDTFEWLMKGGNDGPIVVAGQSASSDLARRIFLPPSHEDAMPPRGQRPLAPADAALIRWWIDQGASPTATVADVEVTPDVASILEVIVGPTGGRGPTLPAAAVPAASADALARVRQAGFTVEPIADGTGYLNVHATNGLDRIDDTSVESLRGLAPQVLWLDLGQTRITDTAIESVATLTNLTRLRLNGTAVSDAGLGKLSRLAHLESLNLYGTRVTDAGMVHIESLKQLRTLYLWQTGVTAEGVASLKRALPKVAVELGSATNPTKPGRT